MTAGVLAILGLAGGVALAFAGAWAVTRGARALPVAAAGFVGAASAAWPAFAFSVGASAAHLPGASVGAVAGGLIATAFLTAVIGASAGGLPPRGVRPFAVAVALAVAVLIFVAYDGQISRSEGGMMVLLAVAVGWQMLQAKSLFRPAEAVTADAVIAPNPLLAAGWTTLGLAVIALATWLLTSAIDALSLGRPDGDLKLGLTVLGLAAALPGLVLTVGAARRGEGGPVLVKIMAVTALGLLAGLGAAALVHPISVSDAFLGAPTVAVSAGAVILLLIAFTGVKPPRAAIGLGAVVYLGFLAAFLGVFG
ncbi:MAG TPA: hypothetical protein VG407_11820 [Caulobacteraceae bacterium]|jgi:cation:H+ antiporter|nr:hypothetical protein [Caulobacteraceae bacterium]